MNQKIDSLAKILTEKNIKPSYQRMKILGYLMDKKTHPTVDKIFNDLLKEIPTLSKATVYNTLVLLKKEDLARVVTIEDNETRFEAKAESHGHLKCETCGIIFDFAIDIESFSTDSLKQFKINEKNVYFKGICPRCLQKINNHGKKGE